MNASVPRAVAGRGEGDKQAAELQQAHPRVATPDVGEREVAAEMLRRVDLHGYTMIADKDFAGVEQPRCGPLGGVRHGIESIIDRTGGPICHIAGRLLARGGAI